jgi:hypothetical protein
MLSLKLRALKINNVAVKVVHIPINCNIKLLIIIVIFPAQVNLIEPGDYFDAWEIDEVVDIMVE